MGDGAFSTAASGAAKPEAWARIDSALAGLAGESLSIGAPHLSARTGATAAQDIAFSRFIALAGLIGLLVPTAFLYFAGILGAAVFAALVYFRFLLVVNGIGLRLFRRRKADERQPDSKLPVFTLLLPLYLEDRAVPGLAQALAALDYPEDLLDIKLLIEEGDEITSAAIEAEAWPARTETLIIPEGLPRTKPRALNYGLLRARGAIISIYDAEDRPHPQQLRAAEAALRRGGDRIACVQAPLQAHNEKHNWLAGQWGLEYRILFGLLLPAIAALRLPLPLGGTSNHFRTDAVRKAGGWDAWNVTEDADLGIRLSRMGWRIGMIEPPTLEEAPVSLGVWTAQRSRWLKGYLQTLLVAMRSQRTLTREIGWQGMSVVLLFIGGGFLAAALHAPLMLWVAACLVFDELTLGGAGVSLISAGVAVNALAALLSPGRLSIRRLWLTATLPLYWPLQSAAAVRALYGLLSAPHFWAKTPHGFSNDVLPTEPGAFAE